MAPRKMVVCIDDNPEVLQALRRQLRQGLEGAVRVDVACNAAQALERLEVLSPSAGETVIIVSDWLMPGMTGLELVRAIEQRWGSLPTVVLSGHITPEATAELEAMQQVVAVMRKPWSSDGLISLVGSLLARDAGGGAGA